MSKERHVIVEKRFIYRLPLDKPKRTLGNKDRKKIQREIASKYERWAQKYAERRGVIGPDGHPTATLPKVSEDMSEVLVALTVSWIVHRRRRAWESFLRNAKPKNILLRLVGEREERK